MRLLLPVVAFCVLPLLGADLTPQLLSAAAAGKDTEVEGLLAKGASVDATDKNGRTALMMAAQHGHAGTVRLLLSMGARAGLREKRGYTAYGLALLEPSGHDDHAAVLQALPQPPPGRISLDAVVAAGGLISSCFMPAGQLKQEVTNLELGSVTVKEVVEYGRASGKGIVEIVQLEKPSDATAQVTLELQPGAACEAQSGDSLNLSIDVRVYRPGDHQLLQEKRFAGGFKGLRKQTVQNASQYGAVYQSWIKPQAGPIYWFIADTLFRNLL